MFKRYYTMILMLLLVTLTGCFRTSGWPNELQVNLASDPTHEFVNVHVTRNFDHGVKFTLQGFEHYGDGDWTRIPINPDHDIDFLIINSEIGKNSPSLSTTASFQSYLNPDYPTKGTFRLVGQMYDLDGKYLKTMISNEFEIENFSFN